MTAFTSPPCRDGARTNQCRALRRLFSVLSRRSVPRRRSLVRRSLAWSCLLWVGVLSARAEAFQAESPYADAAQNTPIDPAEARTVRLNFFNQTWEEILDSVAEDSGSTLIKLDIPQGRITRRDRNHYTRDEAIAILNAELEPQNFRILAKDRYLAVVHRQRARSNYRPRVNAPEAYTRTGIEQFPPQAAREPLPQKYQREVHTIAARPTRQPDPWDEPSPPTAQPGEFQAAAHQRSRPFAESPSGTESDSLPRGSGRSETPAYSAEDVFDLPAAPTTPGVEQRPIPERPITTVVRTERRATEVARFIYASLKDRSELIDVGPEGLPAFRVYRSPNTVETGPPAFGEPGHSRTAGPAAAAAPRPAADIHFEVGIDTERNELVLKAAPTEIRGLAELIRKVDAAQVKPGEAIRLVAGGPNPERIVTRLRPALRTMVAQREAFDQQPANGQPAVQPDPNQPFGPEPPPAQPGQPQGDFPAAGVKGDVEIEVLPGGLLLLRGNLQDVEAVQDLIRRIQELAEGTTPDIELLMLRHVNSEALAALLTDVYETLNELRARGIEAPQTVAFIPVVKPNALLILAPRVELDSILNLANELDQPVEPGAEFEVFRLENAVATQAATTITNTYPAEAVGLGSRVVVIPDARTNSLIVRARPRDMAEVALLVSKLDDLGAVAQMRVFELRNAVADELAAVITNAIYSVLSAPRTAAAVGQIGQQQQQVQLAQEFQAARSMALEFLTTDGEARRIVRSGILADVRVTADARTNSLVVTAPEDSMRMMAELIRRLDQPTEMVAEIKVFMLENSDASAMVELLQTLFDTEDPNQPGGIQVATAADASSGLIPIRFSVDVRTNSVIAIGAAEALGVVEAILLRLDQTDIRQRQNAVIRLRNTPAPDIGLAINQFLQSQRELFQIDPNLVTNVELLEREIIAVPEPVSNSIIVSATPRYFEEIRALIERLDAAPPQVIIQALLVEVELTNTDELGVELGFQDDILFDRSTTLAEDLVTISETFTGANQVTQTNQRIISQATTPGFAFNNAPLGRNVVNPSQTGTQGLSNFSLGRTNADLGFGGLVLSASSSEVSILIRALSARRTVHVLSRPQITTLDNQAALIQVGQDVPLVSAPTFNQTTGLLNPLTTTNTFRNVGIILEVIPRITPDDNIVMEVIATRSNISADSIPLFTDPTTGTTLTSPIFNITTARSTLSVPNGQTIVMGGMITKSDDTIERKVPWLGDIPWIGTAFRYDSTSTRRTELLIFLTPRVIRSPADFELIKQVEAERLHFVEEDAEALHGPLYSVPPLNAGPRGGFDGLHGPGSCPPGLPEMVVPPEPAFPVPPAPSGVPVEPPGFGSPQTPYPEPGVRTPVPTDGVPTTTVPSQGWNGQAGFDDLSASAAGLWPAMEETPGQVSVVSAPAEAGRGAPAARKPRFLGRLLSGRK